MKKLIGKVALVTGASRGIGAEIAKELAHAGASVIVNYSGSHEAAEQVVGEIRSYGANAISVQADVSKPWDVKRLFDESIAKFGKIDILINNAGVILYKLIKDTTDEDLNKILEVNIRGVFNTLREAAERLEENGSIVNFSTSVNRLMMPTYGAYAASKSAVEQLTRVFAKEIGSKGINVNSVSPGPTNTELFMKGKDDQALSSIAALSAFNKIGEPIDIAKVLVFLVGDDAKWISAQNIGINGGMS